MPEPREIELTINGEQRAGRCEPRTTLVDFLRETCALTGTHVGCEHGVCGACTVLVAGEAVRSCLTFAVQADGCEVRTADGLAQAGKLSPLQQAFWEKHGLQCGYCTSGMMMVASELLERNARPTKAEIEEAVSSNLCRCTGYYNIVESVQRAVELMQEGAK